MSAENATLPARRLEQMLGGLALLLLLIGGFTILKAFMTAIMWSIVLGFSLWPAQRLLTKWFGGRRTLAAIVVAITVFLLLVGPLVLLGFSLADDAAVLGKTTRRWIESGSEKPPEWVKRLPIVGNEVESYWREFTEDRKRWMEQINRAAEDAPPKATIVVPSEQMGVEDQVHPQPAMAERSGTAESRIPELLGRLLAWVRSWLPGVTLTILKGFVQVALSVLLTFFILRDGQALGQRVAIAAARIAGNRGQRLINVAGNTVRGVVYGIIGTAVAQGLLAGFGFAIAGVPAAALLGLLAFFLSALPIGPPVIWIPATIWLFNEGRTGWGVFMAIWGMFVVSGVDNIIKPYLISHGSKIPFVLVFLGVIGGAIAFGPVGVFLGPTLLAVLYRILDEWSSSEPLLSLSNSPETEDILAAAGFDRAHEVSVELSGMDVSGNVIRSINTSATSESHGDSS